MARPGATVILYGARIGRGPSGSAALAELLACARSLGAKLLEIPEAANGRGLREVGCLPSAGPGLAPADAGMDADAMREALAARDLDAVVLAEADPVRDLAGGPSWAEALAQARFVLAIAAFENGASAAADVVLPAEAYAEKEGTVTHPDGRLQRLRPAVPHPGAVRPVWQVLAELAERLGDATGLDSAPEVLGAIAAEVPFYAGIGPEEIGGRGVRWQERPAATRIPAPAAEPAPAAAEPAPAANGGVRVGTYRDLWAAEVTERSPSLRFLRPRQTLELAPTDAERLGLAQGDEVDVRADGSGVRARVAIRARVRPGTGFLVEGLGDAAPALAARAVEIERAPQEAP